MRHKACRLITAILQARETAATNLHPAEVTGSIPYIARLSRSAWAVRTPRGPPCSVQSCAWRLDSEFALRISTDCVGSESVPNDSACGEECRVQDSGCRPLCVLKVARRASGRCPGRAGCIGVSELGGPLPSAVGEPSVGPAVLVFDAVVVSAQVREVAVTRFTAVHLA